MWVWWTLLTLTVQQAMFPSRDEVDSIESALSRQLTAAVVSPVSGVLLNPALERALRLKVAKRNVSMVGFERAIVM